MKCLMMFGLLISFSVEARESPTLINSVNYPVKIQAKKATGGVVNVENKTSGRVEKKTMNNIQNN